MDQRKIDKSESDACQPTQKHTAGNHKFGLNNVADHAVDQLSVATELEGAFGQALYLSAPQKGQCVVIETGKVFPNGLYQLRVRFMGTAANSAPVYVGYTTPTGQVVSLGALVYHDEGFSEQEFILHIEGDFADLALWSDASNQQDSVLIDRIVLRSEGNVLPLEQTSDNITQVRDGDSATTTTVPAAAPQKPTDWRIIAAMAAGGAVLLTLLVIGFLLFLGRHYDRQEEQVNE